MFLPPTTLRLLRQAGVPTNHAVCLKTIASGGEALGTDLLAGARENFGVGINEFYGQTEGSLIVGNCARVMPVKPGSMSRAIQPLQRKMLKEV